MSPIFASIISLTLKANYLTTTLLFFGVPSIYLSFRNQHAIRKSLVFSFIFGALAGTIVDFWAEFNGVWYINQTIFPLRILGITPIEDILWAFLIIYNIIMFYEHFLDKGKHDLQDKYLKYLVVLVILAITLISLIYVFNSNFLLIPYFYLITGIILVAIPAISFLSFFPRLLSKYLKTASYFFTQAMMFELTALKLGQWSFNSQQYVGWIEVTKLRFPIEEFVFWMILFSTCVLSYYEFFDDDRK